MHRHKTETFFIIVADCFVLEIRSRRRSDLMLFIFWKVAEWSKVGKLGSMVIIIMDICKAPALRLKALNKHSIAHIMYIEMEMLSATKMYVRKKRKKANT